MKAPGVPSPHNRIWSMTNSRLNFMYSPTRLERDSEIEIVVPKIAHVCVCDSIKRVKVASNGKKWKNRNKKLK